MPNKKGLFLLILGGILLVCAAPVFSQSVVKGRLVRATRSGVVTTSIYDPIVTIRQSETLGVRTLVLELTGVRSANSKRYEFYSDGKQINPVLWRRRERGIVVKPYSVFITLTEGEGGTNTLLINYDYKEKKGYGAVSYIISIAE
ncbi:hypothetical protein FACS189494_09990 [Spirochaetia bacterium]|nr:hypothetical protein FACS189494_09990 [Spirochaetia bacterium]